MEYYPEDKERILAKRAESALRHRTYYPTPTPNKPEWTEPSPLDLRLAKLRKIREEEAMNGTNGGNTRSETESGRMMSLSITFWHPPLMQRVNRESLLGI